MAKSIRSKWKRKMRNIKREKNAPKELERLKSTVATIGTKALSDESVVRVTSSSEAIAAANEKMDTTGEVKKYNKYMLDEDGHYPVWLNKKEKAKMKKMRTKKKKSTKKK